MKSIFQIIVFFSFFFSLAALGLAADKDETPKPAQSTVELQQQIEKILSDTKTPGASVAIIQRDGTEWIAGLGKADVASGRAATPDTLFRIGSVSKAFTSLAILMLADQGKLSLDDPVRKLAPEVWFENRWESTDPVRVVHLIEHTTGWDDFHLREYAKQAPPTMDLREAFDYDHHSRISRWRPGTRVSYSNTGPAVAAYIVEKITGQRIEDFVTQNLFRPIGMRTATYFQPPAEGTTILYHDDGKTPYPYWNIIYRPAGAINASARDMAAYLRFYLNRGRAGDAQVVSGADIDRMEVPASSWAAKAGLKAGYGLSNYWQVLDGFVFHGHNGGVSGGLTEMAYMPANSVGLSYSINSGDGDAFGRIGKVIRAYLTRDLPKPHLPPAAPLPSDAADFAGWYEADSPRQEMTHFLERLTDLSFIRFKDGKLLLSSLDGLNDVYVPVDGAQFRHVPEKEAPDPVATLALLPPGASDNQRRFVSTESEMLKQIPAWLAILEIGLTAFVLLAIVSILIYAPFWLLGGLSRRRRRPFERGMRLWPLLSVLSLFASAALLVGDGDDAITQMGNLTVWSLGFCMATIAFAITAIAGAIALWRAPAHKTRPAVRKFSIAVTAALLIAAVYLAYWGVIGLRTWA